MGGGRLGPEIFDGHGEHSSLNPDMLKSSDPCRILLRESRSKRVTQSFEGGSGRVARARGCLNYGSGPWKAHKCQEHSGFCMPAP